MKPVCLTLCLLCLAPVTRHGGETLMLMAQPKRAPKSAVAPSIITNAPKVSLMPPPFVPPVVTHPPPTNKTFVIVEWTLSTNWVSGPDLAEMTSHLTTGLIGSTNGWRSFYVVTNLPYARSNRVVRQMITTEQLKAFYGPSK